MSAVYVTGVPGVGKSTLVQRLVADDSIDSTVFSYGEALLDALRADGIVREDVDLASLRMLSSELISEDVVRRVDEQLCDLIEQAKRVVLVESHAVTFEHWGMRAVPYSPDMAARCKFDALFMLYDDPAAILTRTARNPEGRPVLSLESLSFAQSLQAAIASNYAFTWGIPLHCIDMGRSLDDVVADVMQIMPSTRCSVAAE